MGLVAGVLLFTAIQSVIAQEELTVSEVDVAAYQVQLAVDLDQQQLAGNVLLHCRTNAKSTQLVLDCGQTSVQSVESTSIKSFRQEDRKLILQLNAHHRGQHEIRITYRARPTRGVVFLPDQESAYSVYFTSEWMICNMNPDDRSRCKIEIDLPPHLSCIASGRFIGRAEQSNGRVRHTWELSSPAPAYTYGFSIGNFQHLEESHEGHYLHYYAREFTPAQLRQIFQYTADMFSFFKEKAGMPYFQEAYRQVMIGHHYQEMSGFAVLKTSYGHLILEDSTETNLIAHELAHQWWGNQITCKDWGHFWLNEGFATFMSAAFNEHRFGSSKYESDIAAYKKVYEKIKAEGQDKSLVFDNWKNPSRSDRNLVYFKGAYVLHLLRQELGDPAFWKGIRDYSRQFYGQSVTTRDFQQALEVSTGRSLQDFFDQWIY